MYEAMAELNRSVAAQNAWVSAACFTTHVRLTGEGGGLAHGIGDRPFLPEFGMPPFARDAIKELLDKQFGPGRAQLRQVASMRAEATDDFHETQLREKPNDPSAHSNYGAFLKDKKGDSDGAEREYRRALQLSASTSMHWATWRIACGRRAKRTRQRASIAELLKRLRKMKTLHTTMRDSYK